MENNNPQMPPPPQGNYQQPNYQQPPQGGYQQGGYQQQGGYNQGFQGPPVDLPGAGSVLTLGILGIIFGFGLLGIIFNIIALNKATKATNEYNLYPGRYTASSFSKVKSGRVCAIIGLCLFAVSIIVVLAINA
jgi:hypothetical protein